MTRIFFRGKFGRPTNVPSHSGPRVLIRAVLLYERRKFKFALERLHLQRAPEAPADCRGEGRLSPFPLCLALYEAGIIDRNTKLSRGSRCLRAVLLIMLPLLPPRPPVNFGSEQLEINFLLS